MRQDDTLAVLVKLDNLERQCLTKSGLCAVLLNEMLWCGEAFNALLERYNGTLFEKLDNLALVNAANSVCSLELVPGVILKLLVTKAQATVVLVDVENDYVDFCANLCEF